MLYHTLDEWRHLLTEDLQKPVSTVFDECWLRCQWFCQILCDFEALGYPADTQWGDPLLQVFKAWVQHQQLRFWHERPLVFAIVRDGDHYQQVGNLAARLSEKLDLPQIHPGAGLAVPFRSRHTVEFQEIQRLATWQTPEEHRAWLQRNGYGWVEQADAFGLAAAWPVFLHYLQWGVGPAIANTTASKLQATSVKWQGLAAEPAFVTWCLLQRAVAAPVTPEAWQTWTATLRNGQHWLTRWQRKHAAHTLEVGPAFQAYALWASCHTVGQPPNWLALVQMLEPVPDRVPTGEGLVADLTL